jgi:hypothetical protein
MITDNDTYIEEVDKPHLKVANNIAKMFNYGDVVTNEWLADNFKLRLPTHGSKKQFQAYAFEFLGMLEGVKKSLLEDHKMYLTNVRGKGYLIVMPNRQSDVAVDKLKKSLSSEINKAFRAITNVNEALLTNEDILKKDLNHGRVAAIAAFSRHK